MQANEYQKLSNRTVCDQSRALDNLDLDGTPRMVQLTHSVVGLAGEVGELASLLQKQVWYCKGMTAEELRQKFKDEFGDVLWYVAEGLSALGLSMEEVMVANVAKLQVRYPDKYTDHHAAEENRDRTNELMAQHKPYRFGNAPEIEQDGHGFAPAALPSSAGHVKGDGI